MELLSIEIVNQLANRFYYVNQDVQKESILDQLGFHPLNHARFAVRLCQIHPHPYVVYTRMMELRPSPKIA